MSETVKGLSAEELVKIFSVLTHDLRSPLFAIEGFTTLLTDGETDFSDEELDFISRIRSSAGQMKRTIESMNKLVKLLARERTMSEIDLGELAERVRFRMRSRAEEADVTIEIEQADWPTVRGDEEALEAALRELVSNAITFAPVEGKKLTVSIRPGPGTSVEVADDGAGIAPEYHEQIFDPGLQLEKERALGPGYGLFAARRIAQQHGGSLIAESGESGGMVFRLSLS